MARIWWSLAWLLVAAPAAAAPPIPVVASFSILADMVREVGGDRVDVRSLVGPDGDAHVYEPSPADARAVSEARLFVINGLGLEGWVPRLERAANFTGRELVASDGIEPLPGPDPHAWQDVSAARRYAMNIAAALGEVDPADAAEFSANLARYDASLAALDSGIRSRVGGLSAAQRRIITAHDAFAYFGRAYDVTFVAPVGISENSEPSAASVAHLIRQIRDGGIRAVFIENMTDPRLIREVADETGVTISGTLYADALSAPDKDGATYVAMMRHNVTLMVAAMQRNE
jgi:zinc/manganese transport system substrate-binding protein